MNKIDLIMQNSIPDKVFNKDPKSNFYKIVNSIAKQLDEFVTLADKVKDSRRLDTALGTDLDKIGELINTRRYANENDVTYRGRLKTVVPSYVGGGTIESIHQVIFNLLGVKPTIIEHYRNGEGHAFFHNGVLRNLKVKDLGENQIEIQSGVSYISGTRITSNQSNHDYSSLSINEIEYIFMDNTGNAIFNKDGIYDEETMIPIAEIELTEDGLEITDRRFILNPSEHYITNTATITVQVPYQFKEDKISFEDTKNIIKSSKAAGIAVLMRIVGLYEDKAIIKDKQPRFDFMVGFSGMGSDSFIGGQDNA